MEYTYTPRRLEPFCFEGRCDTIERVNDRSAIRALGLDGDNMFVRFGVDTSGNLSIDVLDDSCGEGDEYNSATVEGGNLLNKTNLSRLQTDSQGRPLLQSGPYTQSRANRLGDVRSPLTQRSKNQRTRVKWTSNAPSTLRHCSVTQTTHVYGITRDTTRSKRERAST